MFVRFTIVWSVISAFVVDMNSDSIIVRMRRKGKGEMGEERIIEVGEMQRCDGVDVDEGCCWSVSRVMRWTDPG